MGYNQITIAVAALLCFTSFNVTAANQPESAGWYIGAGTRLVQPNDAHGTIKNFDSTAVINQSLDIVDILIDFPDTTTFSTESSQDFNMNFDAGPGLHINLGYDFAGPLRLELEASWQENDIDAISIGDADSDNVSGEATAIFATANLWYDFLLTRELRPYIGGGIGAADMRFRDGEDTVGVGMLGAGLNFPLNKRTTIDIGYRYHHVSEIAFSDPDVGDVESIYRSNGFGLSLRYNFFGNLKNDKRQLDSDGDGIRNFRDTCPNTPLGALVGDNGCPRDSDKDTVWDGLDQCNKTPSTAAIDESGCTLISVNDQDGDGVDNKADMCPNSLAGQPVLSNGCNSKTIVLDGVNFKPNSDELTINGQRALYKAYVALRGTPAFVIEIQGHTDNTGNSAHNLRLSQARANAALNFLSEIGINPDRLFAKGYGDTRPISDNRGLAGRALNRRIELKVELIDG